MIIDDAIDYATQTAAGLQAAHEKGITHRDIKSANIMVTAKARLNSWTLTWHWPKFRPVRKINNKVIDFLNGALYI